MLNHHKGPDLSTENQGTKRGHAMLGVISATFHPTVKLLPITPVIIPTKKNVINVR
jgi:hypothetical protein